ncbi:hypothetical protein [Geofilum rubicundum]|uniref:DUF4382 domain-containing protein n=1 Tax=Geofilum rubicundum JCM 15548 TaxID=1236989 RepID=A0A0E9LVS9_9BACT|nr:hypothetical protein [Geofilum rubicundum]GAO29398.1 hypothetical protein JCM15548_11579 [Geofilum rubicundum JCM 15548]
MPLLLVLITLGGCEKEDFTLPVEFTLNFGLLNEPVLGGAVVIDEVAIELSEISIQGYREQGSDVFLSRSFEQGKSFTVSSSSSASAEVLDIPQGVYNPISFSFTFKPDEAEDDLMEDIQDWLEDQAEGDDLEDLQEDLGDVIQDYLEDTRPCLMVKGKLNHNGQIKHIVVVVNDPLTMQIHGKRKNGSSEISLDKNIVNEGSLQFNPSYWFSVITAPILDEAFVGRMDGEAYILLSKHINSPIYNAVFNRIEESTVLIINE